MYSAKTENLQLPQWNTDDYLQPIADLNPAFEKLDKAVSTDHQNISVLQGALNDFAEQTDERFATQQVVNEQVQNKLVEHDGAIDGLKEFEANQREWNTSVEGNIDQLGNNIAELSTALTKEQEDRIRQDEIIDAKATGAAVAAAQAIEDSETAKQSAEEANERAQAAKDSAEKAEKEAQRAELAAETAQSKAEEAATKSTESAAQATAAQRQAEVAAGYAREAKEASEQAVQTATDAATKANDASTKAQEASDKAIQATADAEQSKTDAASALEQSSQAVETAEEAKRIAEEANGKSDTAMSNSEQAQTDAASAKSTAEGAVTEAAQSAASAKASANKMTEDLNQFKSGYDAQFEDQYEHITKIEEALKEGEGEVGSRLDNIEGDIANAQAAADEAKTAVESVGESPFATLTDMNTAGTATTVKDALQGITDNVDQLTTGLLAVQKEFDDHIGSPPYSGIFKFGNGDNHIFSDNSVKGAFTGLAKQLNLVLADVKAAIPEDAGTPEGLGTFPVNEQYLRMAGLATPSRLLTLPNAATGLANLASTLNLLLADLKVYIDSNVKFIVKSKTYKSSTFKTETKLSPGYSGNVKFELVDNDNCLPWLNDILAQVNDGLFIITFTTVDLAAIFFVGVHGDTLSSVGILRTGTSVIGIYNCGLSASAEIPSTGHAKIDGVEMSMSVNVGTGGGEINLTVATHSGIGSNVLSGTRTILGSNSGLGIIEGNNIFIYGVYK